MLLLFFVPDQRWIVSVNLYWRIWGVLHDMPIGILFGITVINQVTNADIQKTSTMRLLKVFYKSNRIKADWYVSWSRCAVHLTKKHEKNGISIQAWIDWHNAELARTVAEDNTYEMIKLSSGFINNLSKAALRSICEKGG